MINGLPWLISHVACSVLLCYVYMAMLHYKPCARTRRQSATDIALGVFGIIVSLYTTIQPIFVGVAGFYCDVRNFRVSQSIAGRYSGW
jgi:hypothetical protein